MHSAVADTGTRTPTDAPVIPVPSWEPAADPVPPAWTLPDTHAASPPTVGAPIASSAAAEHDPLPSVPRHALRWVAAASLSIIVLSELVARVLLFVGRDLGPRSWPRFAMQAALLLVGDVLTLAAIRVFAMRRVGMSAESLGLRRPRSISEAALFAVATWMMFIMFAGLWAVTLAPKDSLVRSSSSTERSAVDERSASAPPPTLSSPTPTSPQESMTAEAADPEPQHVLLKVLRDGTSQQLTMVLVLSICVLAPLFEELFFRGFVFRAVAARFGTVPGMVGSGVLFGLAHVEVLPFAMMVPIGVLGLALAWLFQQTGSLVPGMFVHAFVNSIAVGVAVGFGALTVNLLVASWLLIFGAVAPWMAKRPTLVNPPLSSYVHVL